MKQIIILGTITCSHTEKLSTPVLIKWSCIEKRNMIK